MGLRAELEQARGHIVMLAFERQCLFWKVEWECKALGASKAILALRCLRYEGISYFLAQKPRKASVFVLEKFECRSYNASFSCIVPSLSHPTCVHVSDNLSDNPCCLSPYTIPHHVSEPAATRSSLDFDIVEIVPTHELVVNKHGQLNSTAS